MGSPPDNKGAAAAVGTDLAAVSLLFVNDFY
jgi:hypothetical protein